MKHQEQNGEVSSYPAVLASQDDNVLMRDINKTNLLKPFDFFDSSVSLTFVQEIWGLLHPVMALLLTLLIVRVIL